MGILGALAIRWDGGCPLRPPCPPPRPAVCACGGERGTGAGAAGHRAAGRDHVLLWGQLLRGQQRALRVLHLREVGAGERHAPPRVKNGLSPPPQSSTCTPVGSLWPHPPSLKPFPCRKGEGAFRKRSGGAQPVPPLIPPKYLLRETDRRLRRARGPGGARGHPHRQHRRRRRLRGMTPPIRPPFGVGGGGSTRH